jgi:hypothetical protein
MSISLLVKIFDRSLSLNLEAFEGNVVVISSYQDSFINLIM